MRWTQEFLSRQRPVNVAVPKDQACAAKNAGFKILIFAELIARHPPMQVALFRSLRANLIIVLFMFRSNLRCEKL
jgi:hypothetical protein